MLIGASFVWWLSFILRQNAKVDTSRGELVLEQKKKKKRKQFPMKICFDEYFAAISDAKYLMVGAFFLFALVSSSAILYCVGLYSNTTFCS